MTNEPEAGIFPRPFGRGPIDAGRGRGRTFRPRPFRGRLVAAPLTPVKVCAGTVQVFGFPRPFGRGPIDANLERLYEKFAKNSFPRPFGRGPIDAALRS